VEEDLRVAASTPYVFLNIVGNVESPCGFPGMFGPGRLLDDSLDVFSDSEKNIRLRSFD
jgi:hypothetical protein